MICKGKERILSMACKRRQGQKTRLNLDLLTHNTEIQWGETKNGEGGKLWTNNVFLIKVMATGKASQTWQNFKKLKHLLVKAIWL